MLQQVPNVFCFSVLNGVMLKFELILLLKFELILLADAYHDWLGDLQCGNEIPSSWCNLSFFFPALLQLS